MITRATAEFAYTHYKMFNDAVVELIETYIRLYGNDYYDKEYIDSFDIEDDNIEVETSYPACNRGCCGYESSWYNIPVSYLWTEGWFQIEDAKREEEMKKKLKVKAEKEKEEEERRQAARLAQYQKLKEEFNDVE